MKSIGMEISKLSASLDSPQRSARGAPARRISLGNLPASFDRHADLMIPNLLWSSWIPSGIEKREIVRALNDDERSALERRRNELEPAMAPIESPRDDDDVALALGDMFSSFPSLRMQTADAIGKIDAARRRLMQFPLWSIQKACARIASEGYEVKDHDGHARTEKHWPPSDAEIVSMVQTELKQRREAHNSAVLLLAAQVEKQ